MFIFSRRACLFLCQTCVGWLYSSLHAAFSLRRWRLQIATYDRNVQYRERSARHLTAETRTKLIKLTSHPLALSLFRSNAPKALFTRRLKSKLTKNLATMKLLFTATSDLIRKRITFKQNLIPRHFPIERS